MELVFQQFLMTILHSEHMKMKSKLLPVTKHRTEQIKYLKYLEFKIIISKQNIPSQLIQLNSFFKCVVVGYEWKLRPEEVSIFVIIIHHSYLDQSYILNL
jgi:hypothetical protein